MYVPDGEAWALASELGRLAPEPDAGSRALQASEATRWSLPGFLGKARVQTTFGLLPLEALRVNDPIVTATGRSLAVRRVRRIGLDRDFLLRHPNAQPIQIVANAFGPGVPAQDILVSPAQELVLHGGGSPRSVKVQDLSGFSAVRAPQGTLTYFSFDLSEPAQVRVEGIGVNIPALSQDRRDPDEDEE